MAGGPIFPNVQPFTLQPGQVANVVLPLQYDIPEVVPTGVLKLQLIAQANATTGVVNLIVSDAAVNSNVNPANATLTAETATQVTFSVVNVWIDTKVTLTAAPTANQILLVSIAFLPTSTLAQVSTWQATLVWE